MATNFITPKYEEKDISQYFVKKINSYNPDYDTYEIYPDSIGYYLTFDTNTYTVASNPEYTDYSTYYDRDIQYPQLFFTDEIFNGNFASGYNPQTGYYNGFPVVNCADRTLSSIKIDGKNVFFEIKPRDTGSTSIWDGYACVFRNGRWIIQQSVDRMYGENPLNKLMSIEDINHLTERNWKDFFVFCKQQSDYTFYFRFIGYNLVGPGYISSFTLNVFNGWPEKISNQDTYLSHFELLPGTAEFNIIRKGER